MSTIYRAVSSVGRAPALQAGGQRFEPVTAHHIWSDGRVGRRRSPAKRVYGLKPYRRFESVSLRQLFEGILRDSLFLFKEQAYWRDRVFADGHL
jgi:hypothetical protein